MVEDKPVIAVTMGEVAGIGPEIILKALNDGEIFHYCHPLIIGDQKILDKALNRLEFDLNFNIISKVEDADWDTGQIHLIDLDNVPLNKFEIAKPNVVTGKAMIEYTEFAVKLVAEKKVHGAVGAPHSKTAANEAGYHFDGYPGLIADIVNSKNTFLMLCAEHLRIANLTLHVSLREAVDMIHRDLVLTCIHEVNKAVREFGIFQPKIAVAGLNPHAGESRMFGNEDEDEIKPAVMDAQNQGIHVEGPLPGDSLFYCGRDAKYDAYIAMYHDQAHIPIKMLDSPKTMAIPIGVPVNWASVTHGCALDIAWKGIADQAPIVEVIKLVSQRKARFEDA